MSASKKTVLITGCSTGSIGAALAKVFHEHGYHVFATLRNLSKAGDLSSMENIDILELEVTSTESIQQCAQEVTKRTGGTLDVLINCAGGDFVFPLLDVDIEAAKKLYDLNVWSILYMSQAFAPLLVKSKGAICNITSTAAVLPLAWGGIYASSKAAATRLSEILRVEMAPLGVRVTTGMLGSTLTEVFTKAHDIILPQGSYYQGNRELIEKQSKGELQSGSHTAYTVATGLYRDITAGKSGLIWHGGLANLIRYLIWLLPMGPLEYLINGNRGLANVKRE